MKFVVSRYNHDMEWIKEYAKPDEIVLYDRSEVPLEGAIIVPNIGSDWFDKFSFICDNYDNLPDVAVYTKANLFKYISKEEFDELKDRKTFTPLLTQKHATYGSQGVDICFYQDGLYFEINNFWYLNEYPVRDETAIKELSQMLGISGLSYLPFAPGSSYIVPKANILKYNKSFYEKLRWYLSWTRYPGEAQIIERGIFTAWS